MLKKCDGRTNGRTDERTDEQTDLCIELRYAQLIRIWSTSLVQGCALCTSNFQLVIPCSQPAWKLKLFSIMGNAVSTTWLLLHYRENNVITYFIVPPPNRRKPHLFNTLNVRGGSMLTGRTAASKTCYGDEMKIPEWPLALSAVQSIWVNKLSWCSNEICRIICSILLTDQTRTFINLYPQVASGSRASKWFPTWLYRYSTEYCCSVINSFE